MNRISTSAEQAGAKAPAKAQAFKTRRVGVDDALVPSIEKGARQ